MDTKIKGLPPRSHVLLHTVAAVPPHPPTRPAADRKGRTHRPVCTAYTQHSRPQQTALPPLPGPCSVPDVPRQRFNNGAPRNSQLGRGIRSTYGALGENYKGLQFISKSPAGSAESAEALVGDGQGDWPFGEGDSGEGVWAKLG